MYVPLEVEQVMPAVPLRNTRRETVSIPRFRLNLLLAKDDRLYLADSGDESRVLVYKVERGLEPGPVCLRIVDEYELSNSHTNNLALLSATNGRSYLLATGGNPGTENTVHNGTLTVLPLPSSRGGSELPPAGKVVALPDNKSAWGVHASDERDLVAVSTNSLRVLVYHLVHDQERDEVVLHPMHTFRSHFCNIPVVWWSKTDFGGQRPVYSASIDGSFAMHCAKSGRRLLQLPLTTDRSDEVNSLHSMRTWCWSLLPLSPSECSPLMVEAADDVFKSLHRDDPRKVGWVNAASLSELHRARRIALRRHVANRHRTKQTIQPLYNDEEADSVGGTGNDVSMCEAATVEGREAATVAWEAGPAMLEQAAESDEIPTVRMETTDEDDKCQYVFLGRQETLHLYHVQRRYGVDAGNGDCIATELQQLRPAIAECDNDGSLRIVSLHHLRKCSALLVVQQGGAVSLVRLLRCKTSRADAKIQMVVEHRFSVDWCPIVGSCVTQRSCEEQGGRVSYSYEIWVVQTRRQNQNASITCYEVGATWPKSNSTLSI